MGILLFEQPIQFLWNLIHALPLPPLTVLSELQLLVVIQMPPEEADPSAPPSPLSSLSTGAGLKVVPERYVFPWLI